MMKQLFLLVALMLYCTLGFAQYDDWDSFDAEKFEKDGYLFSIIVEATDQTPGKVCATKMGNTNAKLVYPSETENEGKRYIVTAIHQEMGFMRHSVKPKEVVLPEKLEVIYETSLQYIECTTIQLPNTLKKISDYVFTDSQISNIVIPEGVEELSSGFLGNRKIKRLYIPKNTRIDGSVNDLEVDELEFAPGHKQYKTVDNVVFTADMKKLEYYPQNKKDINYTVPDGVETLGEWAFKDSKIEHLTLPASVTKIEGNCFFRAPLQDISYPNGNNVKILAPGALAYTPYYDKINVGDVVIYNEDVLLKINSQKKKIVIPDGIKYIGGGAVSGKHKTTQIIIPTSVVYIGKSAFENNLAIKSYDLPSSIKEIDNRAFYDNRALSSISLPEGLETLGKEVFLSCDALLNIQLPSTLKTIGSYCFKGLNITSITIPDGTVSIGAGAFEYCKKLASIKLPSKLKSIEAYTFEHCRNLRDFVFPETIESIGESAFADCYFSHLILPKSIKKIDRNAFNDCSLYGITIYAEDVPETAPDAFGAKRMTKCKTTVPQGCEEKYMKNKAWRFFLE